LVVGYGSIGRRHVRNLLKIPKIEILICTKQKKLKINKKRIIVFDKLEDALKEKPTAAFITNITSKHITTSIKIAKQGIHLFIEKPLSHSENEMLNLTKIVKEKKLVTMMGCNLRFNPCIKKIQEIICKGEIGRIINAQVECGTFLPDWHPSEDYRLGYSAQKSMGGGVILTVIHEIDYLYWLFGNVKEVISISGKYSDLDLDVEDLSASILKFKNNVIAELHLDYFQRPNSRRCKIIGTKGVVTWDENSNLVKVYHVHNKKWKTSLNKSKYNNNQEYIDEIKHFLKCVTKKKKSINDLKQGIDTLKIALAIKKSSKNKCMVFVK
jgi:predicted dehydrogenase